MASINPRATGNGQGLFECLPTDLFQLLSGGLRFYYADLLTYLHEGLLGDTTEIVTRPQVVEAIRNFIDEVYPDIDPVERGAGEVATTADMRPSQSFNRLLETGWLVEYRDRYRRIIEINDNARMLLDLIADIRSGRTRSYGGEVLEVLTQLEGARNRPNERSELIRNAAKSAKSFLRHLRGISSTLRRLEDEILGKPSLREMFHVFFEDFVEKHLISDYARLKSSTNPFKFRNDIIDICYDIQDDDVLMNVLADAYVREGRAHDAGEARETILGEIEGVRRVFENIHVYLDVVETASARLERRVHSTIMNMDRFDSERSARVVKALRAAASLDMAPTDPVPIPAGAVDAIPMVGARSAYSRRAPERSSERVPVPKAETNPAFLALRREILAYRARIDVTPQDIRDYIERSLGGNGTVTAAEMPVESLKDFFVYERIRIVLRSGQHGLSGDYAITIRKGLHDNGWLVADDFVIARREAA